MNGQQMWDAAIKEAERLAEIVPILNTIRENPMDAFNEIISKEKEIIALKARIKELDDK